MRIIIVDDELLIAEMLKEMLQDLTYEVLAIAKNYLQACKYLEAYKDGIDLVFLDINLNDAKSGLDIAALIKEQYDVPFFFLTSYSDKQTIDAALLLQPEGYLMKPFEDADIYSTIELFKARRKRTIEGEKKSTVIKDGTKSIKLEESEVVYMKSDNIYVEIFTKDKKYVVRNSLSKFMEESGFNKIIRVHRTYAVNIDRVKAVNGEFVFVEEEKIPFSRNHREEIFSHFKK